MKDERFIRYKNGNYYVKISKEDGTKIRIAPEDNFEAEFPENIDIKITNYCEMGCPMCHENSNKEGKHASLFNHKFFDTLQAGTELAIGGGMITSHPDLEKFLEYLKERNIFANITVHQAELKNNAEKIQRFIDNKLVYGVGVSMSTFDSDVVDFALKNHNVVFHVINGYTDKSLFKELLKLKGIKVLILGYKDFRRGESFRKTNNKLIEDNQKWLYDNLDELVARFRVTSFDNLALAQLEVRRLMSDSEWESFYMGDDGKHTMYIDLVNEKFAKNSTYPEDSRLPLLNDIKEMFKVVKEM